VIYKNQILLAMKTKNLLPNRWKPLGWTLLVLFVPLGIWYLAVEDDFPVQIPVTIPWPFEGDTVFSGTVSNGGAEISGSTQRRQSSDNILTLNLIDELLALLIMAGLFITGFARLKNEDERIAQMRLEALQWAVYGNTLILVLCIAFIHGFLFLNVMIYNMFTPLLIFVLRFHWLIWQEARELKRQEGGVAV
jgi:hypothetical protein